MKNINNDPDLKVQVENLVKESVRNDDLSNDDDTTSPTL